MKLEHIDILLLDALKLAFLGSHSGRYTYDIDTWVWAKNAIANEYFSTEDLVGAIHRLFELGLAENYFLSSEDTIEPQIRITISGIKYLITRTTSNYGEEK